MSSNQDGTYSTTGMQYVLQCTEPAIKRLQSAVRAQLKNRGPGPYPFEEVWKEVEDFSPFFQDLLAGTGRDIDKVKRNIFDNELERLAKEEREDQGEKQRKRRRTCDYDQDDEEPTPVKKMKTEANPAAAQQPPIFANSTRADPREAGQQADLHKDYARQVMDAHTEYTKKIKAQAAAYTASVMDEENRSKDRHRASLTAEQKQLSKREEAIKAREDLVVERENKAKQLERELLEKKRNIEELEKEMKKFKTFLDGKVK